MKKKDVSAPTGLDTVDMKNFLRLADTEATRPEAVELASFVKGFSHYLTTYIDSEAALSYHGRFLAHADREGLTTVATVLYAECKAAFPDLEVTVTAEDGKAYLVFVGTTKAKNPEETLAAVARATGRDLLALLWAERIAEASGFSLAVRWRGERILLALVLEEAQAPLVLQSRSAPPFVDAQAAAVCRLLDNLPPIT